MSCKPYCFAPSTLLTCPLLFPTQCEGNTPLRSSNQICLCNTERCNKLLNLLNLLTRASGPTPLSITNDKTHCCYRRYEGEASYAIQRPSTLLMASSLPACSSFLTNQCTRRLWRDMHILLQMTM